MRETTDATAIFAPLWRRKWLILLVGIVAGAGSYLYYRHASRTYSTSTQIYLSAGAEEAAPGEKTTKASTEGGDQATIINTIIVPEVRRDFRHRHKGALVTGARVKAKPQEKSLFIVINVEGRTSKGTRLLANTVAQAYVRRRKAAHEASIGKAIAVTRRQLARVEAAQAPLPGAGTGTSKGKANSGPSTTSIIQSANLSAKLNQLEASRAATSAQQVNPAPLGVQIAPKPRQDGIFGFVIGIVLASIAAYAIGRLDRRLRTLEGIESIFGSQLLAALPAVKRPVVRTAGQPRPSRQLLEPLRGLHTMLRLGTDLDEQGSRRRTILFLSPDAGDGKSTIVADLALVQRDSGARVTIVEANFRRPVQSRLLGVNGTRGLADVLTGALSAEEAAQRVSAVPSIDEPLPGEEPAATAVATRSAGGLFLLAGSHGVANPPALLANPAMGDLLQSLADDFDYVLIDAPSPLEFSDVLPLLQLVDGVVLIARAGHTRELSAQRFIQLVAKSSNAAMLGTVANCVSRADLARRGSMTRLRRSWLSRLVSP
jgi:Mrp family chromosome partitioning ATPase/capsular polysaccharide biosynthesis protein